MKGYMVHKSSKVLLYQHCILLVSEAQILELLRKKTKEECTPYSCLYASSIQLQDLKQQED